MRLIAAICTNRTPETVRPALAAVCEQAAAEPGAEAVLVTSGLNSAAHAAHAAAAEELGAKVLAAGAGVSAARNAALEHAGDDDILVFTDDDALPAPDWLAQLAAHWREAAADVGCIGGAIEPHWEAPPPSWVSERVYGAFSLLDLGEGVRELDPSGQDAWGANISFRAGPLREAGGFDPALGAWAGVPMFGDESGAQQRLAEHGLRIIYAGDVRVEHRIGPERLRLRELWRRELHRGASAGLAGRTGRATGAGQALKAAGGLGVALLHRDAPLAGERLARVARGSGAALAPLIGRRLRARGWPG